MKLTTTTTTTTITYQSIHRASSSTENIRGERSAEVGPKKHDDFVVPKSSPRWLHNIVTLILLLAVEQTQGCSLLLLPQVVCRMFSSFIVLLLAGIAAGLLAVVDCCLLGSSQVKEFKTGSMTT